MSMKTWVLNRVQGIHDAAGRPDLAPREPVPGPWREPSAEAGGAASPGPAFAESALARAEHLGAYGPLIAAIRDELEHFVASHVRLHVVIADRDRFLLTSIGVRCPGGAEARDLLHRFLHEFKPEQVKRYLAREIIGGLANAAVIDLSQFAGLADAEARQPAAEADEYGELLAALRSTPPVTVPARPYEVSVIGRWTEVDGARPASPGGRPLGTPGTPLAGARCEFEIEDARGRRQAFLHAVVPGRRYVIGKGEGCDIGIDGTYASRRHAEIWFERNAWHVADAGSTNGIRVESGAGVLGRSGADGSAVAEPIAWVEGARIVLSARAAGPAADYPWIALRRPDRDATRVTPIAAGTSTGAASTGAASTGAATAGAASTGAASTGAASTGAATAPVPKTPLTSVRPVPAAEPAYELTVTQADGTRTLALRRGALPVAIGRSRNQTLVVDRRHDGVSGHHVDIVEIDESGCRGVVHGDNGVLIEGVHHPAGAAFAWEPGQTMRLGASVEESPGCTLSLTRSRGA
jgi:hypothetical protein